MTEERVLRIQATDVDTNGVWHSQGREIPLLGHDIPIPEEVRLEMDPERQEVLMLVNADGWLDMCPKCGTAPAPGVILVTEFTKMYPAHCCNSMIWMTDERDNNDIHEA